MKNFFMSMLAILFPWIVILIDDNPKGAFLALALQVTIIGWIPAATWAWRIVHEGSDKNKKTKKKQEQKEEAE